jgi:hypothetical protein
MTGSSILEHVLVVEASVVRLAIDQANRPESISVEVDIDGRRLRGWEEPGWRDVCFGVAAGMLYWWSARRIAVVTMRPPTVEVEISYDEDILLAFHLAELGWLVVGETSLSIVREGIVTSRLEFGEVIAACRRDGDLVVVDTIDGRSIVVALESDGLRLQT